MKIEQQTNIPTRKSSRVTIDPNPVREREMLDKDGNVIDPRTKQIIKPFEA